MATFVLCRRVPRLPFLRGLRKDFTQAQRLYSKAEDETDEQKGKKGAFQLQEASPGVGYRLIYNPSSYHHSVWKSATSRSQTDEDDVEDTQHLFTVEPSSWQQSNRYSVSCSRHLSRSKETLLQPALNKGPELETPSVSPYHGKPTAPDVKADPRAFHRCRPEYALMSLDLTQRPPPIEWEEAVALLQKVSILKGSIKPSDVSRFLKELSRLHPDRISLVRSNQRFSMLLRYSVENLCLFTDLQLLEVVQSFALLDIPTAHTVLELYEAELSRRANQMTLHQLLLAADVWRCIGKQVPQFLQHLYDAVLLHWGQMGTPELVQLLYIIGEGRYCPTDLIGPVQQLLIQHLQQLYPEEIGTVCLGLFKSQTLISENIYRAIFDKAHSSVNEMSDFSMVNVLKYVRFSQKYHRVWMKAMTKEVPRRAPGMGCQGLMHVALACSAMRYDSGEILTAIAERVPSLVPHCRSKDSSKLLWAFGTLRFLPSQSPCFFESLTEAMRLKKAEFQRFPHHLLSGLLGLAFVSQFPKDLISLALSPDFVELALKSTQLELKNDLLTLDGVVALEFPWWTGPRLSCELREEIAEQLWSVVQSDMIQKPEFQEAESALQDLLGGEEFVCRRMILPHTRSIDLEVHLDSTGQPIPVKPASHTTMLFPENSSFRFTSNGGLGRMNTEVNITEELVAQLTNTKSTTEPLTPSPTVKPTSPSRIGPDEARPCDKGLKQDAKGTVKLAIQVCGKNQHCVHSRQLLGFHAMKRRHLKLAGYTAVELSAHEWTPMLRRSTSKKLAYLECKISDSLTSNSTQTTWKTL